MSTRTRSRRLMGTINVVPFVDVMLVLLVTFVLVAPLISSGVTVTLPKGIAPPIDPQMIEHGDLLILSIDSDEKLYLNVGAEPDSPIGEATVVELASAILRRDPSTPVYIRADQSIDYGQYVRGQALLMGSGAQKVVQVVDLSDWDIQWSLRNRLASADCLQRARMSIHAAPCA